MEKFFGVLFVLSSTIVFASLGPLLKKANQTLPPFTVMTISTFILFLCALILSIAFENFTNLKFLSDKSIVKILFLAGALNTLSFYLAIKAFKYIPIWQQAMFSVLMPVFSAIFAYFILAEKFSPRLFLGLAIMAVGLFIAVAG